MKRRYKILLVLTGCLVGVVSLLLYQDFHRSKILLESTSLPQHQEKTLFGQNIVSMEEAFKRGGEIIDPPLPRQPLSPERYAKTISFIIDDNDEYEHFVVTVVLNPQTFEYRAEIPSNGGFSYTQAAGIVCFTKIKFKHTYCVREKYTPAALVRQSLGDNSVQPRGLEEDEKEISSLMMEVGWVPTNSLAVMMSHVEVAILLLHQDKLADGARLLSPIDSGKQMEVGVIRNFKQLNQEVQLKTEGVHLSSLMQALYNSQTDSDQKMLPVFDFEDQETDQRFDEYILEKYIDLTQHKLVQ